MAEGLLTTSGVLCIIKRLLFDFSIVFLIFHSGSSGCLLIKKTRKKRHTNLERGAEGAPEYYITFCGKRWILCSFCTAGIYLPFLTRCCVEWEMTGIDGGPANFPPSEIASVKGCNVIPPKRRSGQNLVLR